MIFKKIVSLFLIIVFSFSVNGHEKKWPEKRLRKAWPMAQSFTSKQVSLTSSQISQLTTDGIKIGPEDRSPTFYFAQEKVASTEKLKSVGIILFIDEYGANGRIEISVAMGSDGKVKKVDLWEHSENSLISKDDFLNQFIGKTSKDAIVEDKDFQPVKEAYKASKAVALAVQKALKITNIIYGKN
ncbi:MAG: FMN-binding protein [Bdellovibrionales bacterium]|nr:FMN-binding protein [Bdellovibrionales bacterium]